MLSLAVRLNGVVAEMKARRDALLSGKHTSPEARPAPKAKRH